MGRSLLGEEWIGDLVRWDLGHYVTEASRLLGGFETLVDELCVF